ncbi:MAG TPA: enoyl-CoA hydratase/isomerase family protein [Thermoanaerobaculia bacterium]|nr:enoyl-CoA hydratase/isomerase family protein [Thermoanaerobaculia bacterium]
MREYETIRVDRRDGLAILTLDRPEAANTISRQLMADVNRALDGIDAEPEIRVLIVTGAGERHFCGGADLRDLTAARAAATPAPEGARRDFITHFEQIRQPVVAVINGAAMGGGCEIALACDFRLMAEEAKIGQPEILFGALPLGGATQRLPRIVGLAKAKELVLLGRHLTAQEALAIGLVSAVYPRAQLMAEAERLALELAEKAGYALATAKRLVNSAFDVPLAEGLALERELASKMATPEEMRAARERAMAKSATYGKIFSKS